MAFPQTRLRRLRKNEKLRSLIRENSLLPSDFIYPVFVREGKELACPIPSMPGVFQWSVDRLLKYLLEIQAMQIPGIMLFGIPENKDAVGSSAFEEKGIIQQSIRSIKESCPDMQIITDVCLCEYTDHGHCGCLNKGEVDNDKTLELIAKTALSHVKAGADMVAPSGMMDGQIYAIRKMLDNEGFGEIPIMSYAAKYASSFYGPFRDAAQSAPQHGDRFGAQMDPANSDEALREIALDIDEGADIVMIKPALSYLDIIHRVKKQFHWPTSAYNVSGEYAMVKAASEKGWIDERKIVMELLLSIKRAGADFILSYHAPDAVRWIEESRAGGSR